MKPMHILLVEDNEGDIILVTEALEETNFYVNLSIAKNGKDAIDFMSELAAKPEPPSINMVLLDVNLPKKNGHEVLQYMKGNKVLKHIPVVMLTTSSSQRDIDLAMKNEADRYVIKPIGVDNLTNLIDALVKT